MADLVVEEHHTLHQLAQEVGELHEEQSHTSCQEGQEALEVLDCHSREVRCVVAPFLHQVVQEEPFLPQVVQVAPFLHQEVQVAPCLHQEVQDVHIGLVLREVRVEPCLLVRQDHLPPTLEGS